MNEFTASRLQELGLQKSPSHVLAVLLAAEAEVLCSCKALRSISDKPLRHGPGHNEGVWVILLIRRQPLMTPSLLSCLSKRGETSECFQVRFDFTEELHALQVTRNLLDDALMPSWLAGGSIDPVLRY